MGAVESLVEVELVFGRGASWTVRPHGDGFQLQLGFEGELNGLRAWQLEHRAGEILTDGDNVVFGVQSRGARSGPVELPDAVATEADVRAWMTWPAACTSTADEGETTTRYELRFEGRAPSSWSRLRGAAAWLATTADGELAAFAAEAPRIEPERVELHLGPDPFGATQQGDFLRLEWHIRDRPGSMHETLRDNGWLTVTAGGAPADLAVAGVTDGPPPASPPDAAEAGGLALWQEWPCDVTAFRWANGGGTVAEVRFGREEPELWSRLPNGLLVGATSAGRLVRLVVPGVADVRRARGMFGRSGLGRGDPFDALAEHGTSGLVVYGLAGEEGLVSGFGGVPPSLRSLSLTFGDAAAGPSVEVTSSREHELDARMRIAAELAMCGGAPGDIDPELALAPVPIRVDGREAELGVTRRDGRWGGIVLAADTTVVLVGSGRGPEGLELERVRDVAAAARRTVERRGLPPPAPRDEAVEAAGETVRGLIDSLMRHAGAPELDALFTDRVTAARGGPGRYARLLGLHAMLRPINGFSWNGDASRREDDGSVAVTLSLRHASPAGTGSDGGWVVFGPDVDDGVEPDRDAVRRGASHTVALRLVREDAAWKIDTDLLALLERRVGTVGDLVRPLSEQRG